jgi:hypothetical protein
MARTGEADVVKELGENDAGAVTPGDDRGDHDVRVGVK